jgi:hypothetical protein
VRVYWINSLRRKLGGSGLGCLPIGKSSFRSSVEEEWDRTELMLVIILWISEGLIGNCTK